MEYKYYKIVLLDSKLRTPKDYVFRGLTAAELRRAGLKASTYEAENYILETCVQGEENWETALCGVVQKLLKEIYRISGVDAEGSIYNDAIEWIQSETGSLEAVAVALVPGLTLEHLHNCDPFYYCRYLTLGKFQFESLYAIPISEAFKLQENTPQTGVGTTTNIPFPRDQLKPGVKGYDVERFDYRKK